MRVSIRVTVCVRIHLCHAGSLLGLPCLRPRLLWMLYPRLICCPLIMALPPRPRLALPARPLALTRPRVLVLVGSCVCASWHRARVSGSGSSHVCAPRDRGGSHRCMRVRVHVHTCRHMHTARRACLAPVHMRVSIHLHMALAALTAQTARWVCAALGPSVSVLVCGVCLGAGRHLGVSCAIVCGSCGVSWSARVWCGI